MKILFIGSSRIGDFVLGSGVLGFLEDRFPTARFTVVCGPGPAVLAAGLPRLDRVIAVRKRSFHRHWLDVWLKTVGCHWDLVVDLRNTAVSRVILARECWRHRRTPGDRHRVEEAAALLRRAVGFDGVPPPRLWLGETARRAGARLVPAGAPVLAVAPGSTHRHKQWPVARFIDLVGRLTGAGGVMAGARVAVVGSRTERPDVDAVMAAVAPDRRIDLAGPDPIDHIAAALARCRLFIGNDGGAMHFAAATGIPTLGLFGPTPASVYRPWGPDAEAVLCATPYPELQAALAAGLATGTEDAVCLMESLAVETVAAAAEALYHRCGPVSGGERVGTAGMA